MFPLFCALCQSSSCSSNNFCRLCLHRSKRYRIGSSSDSRICACISRLGTIQRSGDINRRCAKSRRQPAGSLPPACFVASVPTRVVATLSSLFQAQKRLLVRQSLIYAGESVVVVVVSTMSSKSVSASDAVVCQEERLTVNPTSLPMDTFLDLAVFIMLHSHSQPNARTRRAVPGTTACGSWRADTTIRMLGT